MLVEGERISMKGGDFSICYSSGARAREARSSSESRANETTRGSGGSGAHTSRTDVHK